MSDIITREEFGKRFDAVRNEPNWKELHAALHREYYGAYVKAFNIKLRNKDLLRRCREALEADDVYMNSPHTSLREWDDMKLPSQVVQALRSNGEGYSLSTNICIWKEAARQQIEAETPSQDGED